MDPSIEVDVKLNPAQRGLMQWKMRNEAKKEAIRQQQKERMMLRAEMQRQQVEEMRLVLKKMLLEIGLIEKMRIT